MDPKLIDSRDFAFSLAKTLESSTVSSISDLDPEDLFIEDALCVFIFSTYTDGGPTESAQWFYTWLHDAVNDFRVQKDALSHLRFAVVGLGDTLYGANFCRVAKETFSWLCKLSAKPIYQSVMCDDSNDSSGLFEEWKEMFVKHLNQSDKLPVIDAMTLGEIHFESSDEEEVGVEVPDLEDLKIGTKNNSWNPSTLKRPEGMEKPMVTPSLHKALSKQGYKIIGSHSGVKICRWTKSMLRGRGGCYKHTFYGIESHRCMETTPSLACANKCVFCWRHHTNPVGTEWRWKMNEPEEIINGAMESHYKMIKELRGLPGLVKERFEEAMAIKHCALSLVGEPIMYPKINEFVDMLHAQGISSFLVTNAQFPDRISDLKPVTQLYVSIDAANKESLKAIDRPLFADFWERYLASLQALATKPQRTVFRLTLVKDYNVADLDGYVRLVRLGQPDFIEVKGVTFCGYSGANPLTMSHVPFHREVIDFVEKLIEKLGTDYALSCEHEHSCSILIAHRKYLVDNQWHTWIDYDKFQRLVKSGIPFDSLDYVSKTPDWAIYGAKEHGFDPEETRFFRKKGTKETPLDHGC